MAELTFSFVLVDYIVLESVLDVKSLAHTRFLSQRFEVSLLGIIVLPTSSRNQAQHSFRDILKRNESCTSKAWQGVQIVELGLETERTDSAQCGRNFFPISQPSFYPPIVVMQTESREDMEMRKKII